MRSTSHTIAALVAAGAASIAFAQTNTTGRTIDYDIPTPSGAYRMTNSNVPSTTWDVNAYAMSKSGKSKTQAPDVPFVEAPVATAAKADPEEAVSSIVQALNADASLKNSKVTVSSEADSGTIYIVGAALTRAQKDRIGQIAMQQAGEGKYVNAVLDDET